MTHPSQVMVALLVDGSPWVLMGTILAILTAAILSVIIEEVAGPPEAPENS